MRSPAVVTSTTGRLVKEISRKLRRLQPAEFSETSAGDFDPESPRP